jgi:hypothetical protein
MFKLITLKNRNNKFKDLSFKTYQEAFKFIYQKVGFHGWYIENHYEIKQQRKVKQ